MKCTLKNKEMSNVDTMCCCKGNIISIKYYCDETLKQTSETHSLCHKNQLKNFSGKKNFEGTLHTNIQ